MAKNKFTTQDIAKKAGVSPATVSRVVRHRHLVADKTVELVENAMKELGIDFLKPIIPKSDKKDVILVNCPQGTNPFYEDVIAGVISSSQAHGFYTILNYTPITKDSISDFIQLISTVNASGVITFSLLGEELLTAINSSVPIIQCCEYNKDAHFPYVSIDDITAAKNVVKYLIDCGRNKIAFLNGPKQYKYSRDRQEGFYQAMEEAKLFVPSNWVINVPEINYSMTYAIVNQLLTIENRPNAIFAASDVLAAAVINSARNCNILIPDDLMVVGFDNIELSKMTRPTITSVNQPKTQLGFSACELLIENIKNGGILNRSLHLSTELIIRESTTLKAN